MGIIDDILAKEPEQRTAEFCMDRQLAEELSEAQAELERAKRDSLTIGARNRDKDGETSAEVDAAQERVDELTEQAKSRLVRFTFAAIDPTAYDELKGQHRPTERQLTAARKAKEPVPEWNVDSFPPVLVAAACVKVETPNGTSDGLTLEEALQIFASPAYNKAERGEIFNKALSATLTRVRVDLPKSG